MNEAAMKKLKKQELIDYIIKHKAELQGSLALLVDRAKRQKKKLVELEIVVKRLNTENELWGVTNKKVYIESKTLLNKIRTYNGIVELETQQHLKLKATCNEGIYYYIIDKSTIRGVKVFGDWENVES